MVQDLSHAIKGLEGHHTAQLTAGACLALLCFTEMVESTEDKHVPTPDLGTPNVPAVPLTKYLAFAVQQGAFDKILCCIHEAIVVSKSAQDVSIWLCEFSLLSALQNQYCSWLTEPWLLGCVCKATSDRIPLTVACCLWKTRMSNWVAMVLQAL